MNRVINHQRTVLVVAGVATLAGVGPATADLIEWTAPGDGSFHNASNWSPGMVPGPNDLAGFGQSGTTSTITFNGDAQTLSLELTAGDYTFDLGGHTYAFVDIAAPINLVGTDGYALTFVDGTVTSWSAAMFGTGEWTIGAGATVDLGNDLTVAGASNDLYVDGGILTAQSARIADGASSSANVWLTGGGLLSVDETVRVGHVAGGDGYLGVGGAGTRLEAVNLFVGTEGTGRFSVTELAEAEIENVTFGGNGTAEVHVRDGGELKSTLDLCVGNGAVLEIGDLGVVDALGFGTDIQPGGHVDLQSAGTFRTGSLDVDGLFTWAPGSTLDIGSNLRVEPNGPLGDTVEVQERTLMVGGTLIVQSNAGTALVDVHDGVLEAGGVLIAQPNGSFAQLRVRGATAGTATVEGDLYLGTISDSSGAGELDVEDGGVLTIGNLLRIGPNCLVDVKPDSQLTVAQVFNDGNFDQQGGLVLIGGDLPPGVTSGFVLNRIGEEATFTNGTAAQLVTPGGAIGTGPGGSAAFSAKGDWFCFGPLEIGRTGEPADAAQMEIRGLVSVTGDAVIHESGLVNVRFSDAQLFATRLENHGRIIGTGDLLAEVVNAGRIEVHGLGQAQSDNVPGVLRVIPSLSGTDAFEQTVEGTLALDMFDLGEYDRLHVNVPTQLGGTLEITLVDGFEPMHGALYEIITALDAPDAVITGTFDAIVPAEFEAVYTSHAVLIRRIDPCPADLDDSGHVGFDDLALLLGNWGPCPLVCPPRCQWDLDGSNHVGFNDLALLLGTWGACP